MDCIITVNRGDVYAEASIVTAYIGGKTGEYERLPIIDADEQLVDVFWREAQAWAASELGSMLKSDMSTGDEAAFEVEISVGASTSVAERLLRGALGRYVMARWLEVCGHGASVRLQDEADKMIARLKRQGKGRYPSRRSIPPI